MPCPRSLARPGPLRPPTSCYVASPSVSGTSLHGSLPPCGSGRNIPGRDRAFPHFRVAGDIAQGSQIPMFRQVCSKVLQAAPRLDLWPVLPMMFFSARGKELPLRGQLPSQLTARRRPVHHRPVGRLGQWSRVHLVDASVFPTVPATTFTLTIMANAHRIATETLGHADDEHPGSRKDGGRHGGQRLPRRYRRRPIAGNKGGKRSGWSAPNAARTCRRFVLGSRSRPTSLKASICWSTAHMTWR